MQQHYKYRILAATLAIFFLTELAGQTRAKHPNLFLNREEIEQVRTKVKQQLWAASLLEQLKARSRKENPNQAGLSAAMAYTLTGEQTYGDFARRQLLGVAHNWLPKYATADLRIHPPFGSFAFVSYWAWSYDLLYDT